MRFGKIVRKELSFIELKEKFHQIVINLSEIICFHFVFISLEQLSLTIEK